MKRVSNVCWMVTIFFVVYFALPKLCACVANPTNYCATFSQPVPVEKANIIPIVDERQQVQPINPPDDTPQPKVWGLLIAFIIAIAVIAYIIYNIIKLLDKVIPPPKKPDPPPNSGNTNYPPVVVNPSSGPGPAVALKRYEKQMALTNSTGFTITNYDIVPYQWANTWEKGNTNILFDHYWAVGMEHTTNMITWEDSHYTVECFYTTSVGVLYRYRHYGTNFYQCYYRSDYIGTNHAAPAYFDLTDNPFSPMRFFRLVPQ